MIKNWLLKKSNLLVIVAGFVFWAGQGQADMNVVGNWAGVDSDGDSASFVFNSDKSAEVKFEGVPLLSSSNMVNGSVEWIQAVQADHRHLDVVILTGTGEEQGRIRMIARFVDEDRLEFFISRDMKTRPTGFGLNEKVFQINTTRQ
ncbi:MAG: hypothetical protein AAF353_07450 [Pseudomonadota bacterium]